MITVLAGTTVLGFVLPRGRLGFEGFTAAEQSLGLFKTQREAAEAVGKSAAPAETAA